MTIDTVEPLRCDYCREPVHAVGVETPHYTHIHGSVICHPTTATVAGLLIPSTEGASDDR